MSMNISTQGLIDVKDQMGNRNPYQIYEEKAINAKVLSSFCVQGGLLWQKSGQFRCGWSHQGVVFQSYHADKSIFNFQVSTAFSGMGNQTGQAGE